MKESIYQLRIIRRLEKEFPGCVVIKNDPTDIQGIPDLLILFGERWAMLEVKVSRHTAPQPNQRYYVDKLLGMSFAAFIYPENEERIFDELSFALCSNREARLPQS